MSSISEKDKIAMLEERINELENDLLTTRLKLNLLERAFTGYINNKLHRESIRVGQLMKYNNYIDLEKLKFYSENEGSGWVGYIDLGPNITIHYPVTADKE